MLHTPSEMEPRERSQMMCDPAHEATGEGYSETGCDDAKDPNAVEALLHEFFNAPRVAASNHEEWLLRLCAQMMHREAAARAAFSVSMQGRGGRRRARARTQWTPTTNAPTSSGDSAASTGPSMGTGGASWSES